MTTPMILALTGRKQSGKDTLADFLIANKECLFGPGFSVVKMGFADPLKKMVSDLFGIPLEWMYGTEEDKNRPVPVRWINLPYWAELYDTPKFQGKNRGEAFLTVRELLQQFGTEIVRKMNPHAWVHALQIAIRESHADLVVIVDARFPNEVKAIKGWGGKVIRLTRNGDAPPEHESEWALDEGCFDWKQFDAVIDNIRYSKRAQEMALADVLRQWGWTLRGETIETESR